MTDNDTSGYACSMQPSSYGFLSDPGIPGVRSMGPECLKLTEVVQVKQVIQNIQVIQVTQPGGQICNQCKWHHLVAKFGTNAIGAIWWTTLQLMQIAPSCGHSCGHSN